MKLPNGDGTVFKMSGNRRNPWRARKTIGWEYVHKTEKEWYNPKTGKVINKPSTNQIALKEVKSRPKVIKNPTIDQINNKEVKCVQRYINIGYYHTRSEAISALYAYNNDPYDIDSASITFAEIYEKWTDEHFPKVSESNIKGIKASYKLCDSLNKMKMIDIKLSHLQAVVDNSGKNTPTLRKLKIMWGLMWDYCVKHEILTKDKRDMIRYVDISQAGNPNGFDRKPFSRKEIEKLWNVVDSDEYLQFPLILIYSGVRIGEFMNLKKEDVHLDEKWFYIRDSKTESGVREVPIADKIFPFFQHWMNKENSSGYIFTNRQGKLFRDKNFRDSYWNPMMETLNMEHRPHDTRHTCVSLLTTAGIDERIIKQIVGHKGQGVTETVYTHLDLPIKLEAINKI